MGDEVDITVMPIIHEMREANSRIAERCVSRIEASFDKTIMLKIIENGSIEEFKAMLKSCFLSRQGAHILGLEFVEKDDKSLFDFLDKLFPTKFSEAALQDNLTHFYITTVNKQTEWQSSVLAARAEEAAASADAKR